MQAKVKRGDLALYKGNAFLVLSRLNYYNGINRR
jgi:hypothetical protein